VPLLTHGDRGSRRVALTFDDGPSEHTGTVLDALRDSGARATFNVVGRFIPARAELLRRGVAEGHEIGNHGLRHERLSERPARALEEILRTTWLIRRAAGVRPRIFRPPYGWVSPGVVTAARVAGLVTLNWDVNPRDWEGRESAVIVEDVMTWVRPGSVVSLHDGRGDRTQTAGAVVPLVEALRADGYEPVTASELLRLSS
jgi:peptidoglycan/xylan/chitin deacetylase (PgdA/CDA1 family)